MLNKLTEKEKFSTNFLNIKLFLFLLILIISIVNKDLDFYKLHKKDFIIETFIFALLSTIPMIYIQHKRIGIENTTNDQYIKLFIWFFIMIIINIGMEFSGLYSIIYSNKNEHFENNELEKIYKIEKIKPIIKEPIKEKEKELPISTTIPITENVNKYIKEIDSDISNTKDKNKKILKGITKGLFITIGIILFIIVIYLIYLSFKIKNFNIPKYKNNIFNLFLIETILFSLGNSLPLLLIVYNRKISYRKELLHKTFPTLFLLMIKMAFLHIILQTSGFYNDMYNW